MTVLFAGLYISHQGVLPLCVPVTAVAGTSSSTAGRPRTAEQMTDEELKAALPSMLFTTSNLIWSSELSGVAAPLRKSHCS
jgi:hypothetical protein